MADELFKKLATPELLKRAWHLARNDARSGFIFDSLRYADYAFRLDNYLEALAEDLRRGGYRPQPLLSIDVPKSSLSVRPGTSIAISDRIVLFAVVYLIAPRLDRKLPREVYSWRLKKKPSKKELFEEHELIKFTFLKSRTIRRRIDIAEPWYRVWPRFVKDTRVAFEEEGYSYMVVSDITAYFENINLQLLRDQLLQHLPREQRLVNLLVEALEYWTPRTVHGATLQRGLPQGNAISSFLGNFFLLPLDIRFRRFAKKHEVKYLRYMDDVKVLAKDEGIARQALFEMIEGLRDLHLNIQGAKTTILEGEDIRKDLVDANLEEVNKTIESLKGKRTLSVSERSIAEAALDSVKRRLTGRRSVIPGRQFRVFRRLITGYSVLESPGILDLTLKQLRKNPDARLIASAIRYFRSLPRNRKKIAECLTGMLAGDIPLFGYQEAYFLMGLRYLRWIPKRAIDRARKILRARKEHWYVRVQAALLLAQRPLSGAELRGLHKRFHDEREVEVRRALAVALVQLPKQGVQGVAQELVFSVDPLLQRLGRYYHGLLFDEAAGKRACDSLFRDFNEDQVIERLHEIDLLKNARSSAVRQILRKGLKTRVSGLRHPIVRARLSTALGVLDEELGGG